MATRATANRSEAPSSDDFFANAVRATGNKGDLLVLIVIYGIVLAKTLLAI